MGSDKAFFYNQMVCRLTVKQNHTIVLWYNSVNILICMLYLCVILSCERVYMDELEELRLIPEEVELILGEETTLATSISINNLPPLIWTSSNPDIATIDNNGRIVAKHAGTTTIMVNTGNIIVSAIVTVHEFNSFWLDGIQSAYSDMTWVDSLLVGVTPSSDDLSIPGRLIINEYKDGAFSKKTKEYSLNHRWGHCNTIDYNKDNDCLILGNGSGDYTLPGKIIIIPEFRSIVKSQPMVSTTLSFEDSNALVIDCQEYGFGGKFNVLWNLGNADSNHAYLITSNINGNSYLGGDMEVVRELEFCKNSDLGNYGKKCENKTPYNGTFRIVSTYSQRTAGYTNCNQGSCYYNGELCVVVGHEGFWFWRMRLFSNIKKEKMGMILKKEYKTDRYSASHNTGNASGIAAKDGYLFVGCVNKGIMAINIDGSNDNF